MTKKNKNRLFIILSFVVICLLSATYIGYTKLYQPAFNITQPVHIWVTKKSTSQEILKQIEEKANPKCTKVLELLANHYNYKKNIKAGHYVIQTKNSALQTMRMLTRGYQTPVRLVIKSVRSKEKMAKVISQQLMLDSLEIINAFNDSARIHALGYTKATFAAFFVPNTYEVYWNMSIHQLFQRLKKEHQHFWNAQRLKTAKKIGLSPIEVSTLASIVDEETANRNEKRVVAGLYLNRLRKGMLLQADPTVKFAWQDPSLRRILNKHLSIDSPYNTYKYVGLPPGPIRFPSMSAIKGVLNYAQHNYLYMCAKEDFSGTHNFARTLSEHMRNARKYQRELNKRGIR
jgi:UPF0755 protein